MKTEYVSAEILLHFQLGFLGKFTTFFFATPSFKYRDQFRSSIEQEIHF